MLMNTAVHTTSRRTSGMTLIEILIVLTIMSVIMAMGLPKLDLSRYRADAAAQQVASVFQVAQRTSLTRQYDVIVSVDTNQNGLRIAEDVNNDGTIQVSEWKFWRPIGQGNKFMVPPRGLNTTTLTTSVVGSQLTTIDAMPSVIFHRDGSSSTDAEMYVGSTYKNRIDYRAISVTRATGRSEIFRLGGTGTGATWRTMTR
jgi:prepilin-type N-terminal cleavage/methylation domain-containing protein